MGCCKSCLKNESGEDCDERSPLLHGNKSATSVNVSTQPLITHADYPADSSISSSLKNKQNEQAILSSIVANLDKKVIDITAIDSKISSGEYMDRVQLYSRKAASVSSSASSKKYNYPSLPSVSNDPLSILTYPLRPYDELELIRDCSQDLSNAFSFVRVQRNTPLVSTLSQR